MIVSRWLYSVGATHNIVLDRKIKHVWCCDSSWLCIENLFSFVLFQKIFYLSWGYCFFFFAFLFYVETIWGRPTSFVVWSSRQLMLQGNWDEVGPKCHFSHSVNTHTYIFPRFTFFFLPTYFKQINKRKLDCSVVVKNDVKGKGKNITNKRLCQLYRRKRRGGVGEKGGKK